MEQTIEDLAKRVEELERIVATLKPVLKPVFMAQDEIVKIIQKIVADEHEMCMADMASSESKGCRNTSWVRQMAMALSQEYVLNSQFVAKMFNREDHGTVLNAVKKVNRLKLQEPHKSQ